jgi:hypothetical protein
MNLKLFTNRKMYKLRYDLSLFSYNSILAKCFTEPPQIQIQQPIIITTATTSAPVATATSTKITPSSLSPPSPQAKKPSPPQQTSPQSPESIIPTPRPITSKAQRNSVSTTSLRSSSVTTGNEDDYFTADEDEEEEAEKKKKEESENNPDRTFEGDELEDEEELASTTLASNSQATKTAGGTTLLNDLSARHFNEGLSTQAENKMDLNFDIKRPILDSSLPKYCYLKYLSRAQVRNWNRTYLYPCYHDSTQQNIFFSYRQHGINFFNLVSTSYSPKTSNYQATTANEAENSDDNDEANNSNDCKCRINLKFSVFECYITPLFLTGLGRFIEALNQYKVSPNSLITQLQTKAQAHSAANSFKGMSSNIYPI